ncbi:MAG: hypothetical protein HY912_21345 [Desulfomonile tiedjei]|uniref:Uncharacterized protein n=1 Tax=Desulfomonile tiedjei TaxID=2358 RepID=A0A9D6V7B5_9BACT|nr:hypothetical protein [Desulfomonile tiedjei]
MKKKVMTFTKTTRLLKVAEVLDDMFAGASDEELLKKYCLTWKQLHKVYSKLFYGGFISKEVMVRRIELRSGGDASHIPVAEIEESRDAYECMTCGFSSSLHFSECPRCKQINLRRLMRRTGRVPLSAVGRYAAY